VTPPADARHSARQVAAILTLLTAAVATLATSPPYQSSRLSEQTNGNVHLDAVHPSAKGTVTMRFSPEALPASSGGIYLDGTVSIQVGAAGSAGIPGASAVLLTVSPQGSTPALTVSGTRASARIADLCAIGRLCELTYVVPFEFDGPLPTAGIEIPWSAEASLTYTGRDIVPQGASITVRAVDPFVAAPAPPGLEASLGEEEITLSVDHPVAVRHVDLELSTAAVQETGDSPITGVMELTTTWLDRPATGRFDPTPFDVLVIPDESPAGPAAAGETLLPRSVGTRFDPFTTCVANRPCRRGVAVVFEWLDDDPTAVHRVSWTSIVRVRYPGVDVLRRGATLKARVDLRQSAGAPAASLRTEMHETIRIVTTEAGRADGSGRLVFVANAAALPVSKLGLLPPPSVGLITVNVLRADGMPIASSAIHISLSGSGVLPHASGAGSQASMAAARPFPVFPLRICEVGQPCEVEVGLSVWVQDPNAPIPAGTQLDVVVTVDATLPYLDLVAPPGSGKLTIEFIETT
jgi:hypothetical protein